MLTAEAPGHLRSVHKSALLPHARVTHRVPGQIKRREVELDPQVSPEEIMSREVELDPQVSPEEIMSREVELGCESWTCFASSCSSTAVQRTLSL